MKTTILISFIIFNLVFSSFCFAQGNGLEVPETLDEAQEVGEQALEIGKKELPDIIKELWYENVLPVWQKMYDWFYANIWLKIKNFFGPRIEQEIETRKEVVDQEFEQEKEEVKKELPGLIDKIWQFIKDAIYRMKLLWE